MRICWHLLCILHKKYNFVGVYLIQEPYIIQLCNIWCFSQQKISVYILLNCGYARTMKHTNTKTVAVIRLSNPESIMLYYILKQSNSKLVLNTKKRGR